MRYGLILAFICVVAAGLLAGVNALTRPLILAQMKAEEQAALKEVMPSAARFTEIKSAADQEVLYYKAFNNQDSLDLSKVQAIAGATISSRAVINSIQEKAQEIKELIKNEK